MDDTADNMLWNGSVVCGRECEDDEGTDCEVVESDTDR